jgi:hypothetical protein
LEIFKNLDLNSLNQNPKTFFSHRSPKSVRPGIHGSPTPFL